MTSKRNIDNRLNELEGDGAASDTPTYDEQYCEAYQAIVESQMRLPSELRTDEEIDDVPTLSQTLRSCLSVGGTDEGDRVVARRLSKKATKTSENWDAVDQLCLELLHSKHYMDEDEVGEFCALLTLFVILFVVRQNFCVLFGFDYTVTRTQGVLVGS